ncbi:hypothetical protein J3R82DRAFT_9172 [Butyriboletus roseoflavus]|nr:hypothetical protein J3R82DRAFT_9172 [Butyriboletus roseoflavus]
MLFLIHSSPRRSTSQPTSSSQSSSPSSSDPSAGSQAPTSSSSTSSTAFVGLICATFVSHTAARIIIPTRNSNDRHVFVHHLYQWISGTRAYRPPINTSGPHLTSHRPKPRIQARYLQGQAPLPPATAQPSLVVPQQAEQPSSSSFSPSPFVLVESDFKRLNFLDAITRKRKQIHSRATLLDGEDLAEVGLQRPPHGYTDYETPWDAGHSRDGSDGTLMAGIATPGTPQTLTRPSRWSEIGSAFKEEIWSPPHEGTRLMDPLANDIDLGRIVDDVMGPSSTAAHFSDRSVSSMYRDSVAGSDGAPHSRTVSNASNAALLEAAGFGGTSGAGVGSPLTTAPMRSSPLAHPGTKPDSVEHSEPGCFVNNTGPTGYFSIA